MKQVILLLLAFLFTFPIFAQTALTGNIIDSEDNSPLQGTLVVLKDTQKKNIIRYTQTDAAGKFTLTLKKEEVAHCSLQISMMGYKPQEILLTETTRSFRIAMQPAIIQIKEVTVKAKKIREEGDTLVYNVASFTDKQDKTIGDVMRKMPGVEVAKSGKITYNGTNINKFYIEGKDLLEGKYGIATNGISPDDVGSVEIMEDHQPIRVLQGISLSSQAAVNLRLKNSAKAKWIINALAMGGISTQPKGGLWSAEAFAMQMKRNKQNITLYKTNNIGKNLGKDVSDLTMEEDAPELSDYIQVNGTSITDLEQKRTLFNRSHLFSTSQLWGLGNDREIKAQVNYLDNRTTSDDSSIYTYYLPEENKIVLDDRKALEHLHQLSAGLTVEANCSTFYLKNILNTNLQWRDVDVITSGTLPNAQQAEVPVYKIGNTFSLIKRFGKQTVSFYSRNSWQLRPQSLDVQRGIRYQQETREQAFFTQESANYGMNFKHLVLSMDGGVTAMFRDLNSHLHGLPDSLGILTNVWTTRYASLYITPKLEYKYRRIDGTLELPVHYYHYSFAHKLSGENDWTSAPSLRLRWNVTPHLRISVRGRITPKEMNLHSLYNGLILTDYRTLSSGMEEYATTSGQSLSGALNFKQPIWGLFANAMVIRSWNCADFLQSQQFTGDYIMKYYTQFPNKGNSWTALGTVSSNIECLKGMAGINFLYQKINRSMLSERELTDYSIESYNLTGRLNGRIGEFANWQYLLDYGQNNLNINHQPTRRLNRWQHTFSIFAVPFSRLSTQLSGEYYHNEVVEHQYKDMLLLDGKISYNLGKHIELSATLSNLFNRRTYGYSLYSETSVVRHERMLRGREFLLSFYLKR
ncbi:carboxypeptidase-like regulatory domain-containing protein [Phocaeicola sp.]